ncbi:hypothetical protein BC939DRAFT_505742 [Gamsiella multidivaricata]|uniref:uncharacterized protein n=1 Tax=Gamsiella multidivaricata TaxID=101098 RepID=UPI00222118D2|nr:uncharacterized protein BC939DRAFT_505742 [Gamsiella multidivaricata]KAG0368113.1 hypothetical protein BGZ54_002636 [Gamsiella multidivaricata]KAI7819394.1 hypothetical protein BC939DRAFT_505742 [Gamsiella multidivaricata]
MDNPNLKVLIVGAGVGGLALAILLEKAGIAYEVYERASKVRPLGSAVQLNANILPLFEQLGIFDQIWKIGKPVRRTRVVGDRLQNLGSIEAAEVEARMGYPSVIVARPELYDILLSQVPASKIHMSKKITAVEQDLSSSAAPGTGVKITCSDGTAAQGDILVGADGAYSVVRDHIYNDLLAQNRLPASDAQELSFTHTCLVGTTKPLDPEKFPIVREADARHMILVSPEKRYSVWCFLVSENRICWFVTLQLERASSKAREEKIVNNSEWGPEAAEAMCQQVKNFKMPYGGELGDLIEQTDKGLISKVMLEEKHFKTWYDGRSVLIGDACHKMLPSGGQGAINAMHDAIILANMIYDIPKNTPQEITNAFKKYQDKRFSHAEYHINTSKQLGKILMGVSVWDRILRKIALNYVPKFLVRKAMDEMGVYQPQAGFLPLFPHKGFIKPLPQEPCKRYLEKLRLEEGLQNPKQNNQEEQEQIEPQSTAAVVV